MKCTKNNIKKSLEKIGWELREGHNGFAYIYDQHGKNTGNYLFGEKPDSVSVELRTESSMRCDFFLKDCKIKFLAEGDAFCICAKDNESVFLLFMNHGINKQ